MGFRSFYADLHIHIGRTESGQAVKISASNNLTFYNITHEASERKGIDIVGIIDCQSPAVQHEMQTYLDKGEMEELHGGGIRYHNTTVILGSEIEVRDPGMGTAHLLAYLPNLAVMQEFTVWMGKHMKNVGLSSQRIYVPAKVLQQEVLGRGGLLIPAHIFTPHKSVYGSCSTRMEHLLDLDGIAAVELGLSADSEMAGYISELDRYTYLTNSDAHSLAKIGREYNVLKLEEASFEELRKALAREDGRGVQANYGLNPRLGKYHRTYCADCSSVLDEQATAVERCLYCGSKRIVNGVLDRILNIADREVGHPFVPEDRPAYHYQVPLEYIPGLGPKKLQALLERFGTEMNLLHKVSCEELEQAAGTEIAEYIVQAREDKLMLQVGGGGKYGKVTGR
ncbi:endonuclease Q family protein [Paenibacillus radicis (ex Xue et al. 2023)]|uniref:Endonuclease Q family protein n=1 Tax=Paenibacillus radicis (ex Xue et al. 2023) TaxID=2972489 RepID=A0ABT1YL06_9BACL|nr:endonuclease Q family protein [Paenibacillus radicis (ex Xue et al. 2023)]MCR8633876.1 endonuclease Q family protein [Paenibacillus radicis (ex Xue et al. 2023)]